MAQQWEDQGLYFALIFNTIVMLVLMVASYFVYKRFPRVTRPNRPGSRTATFFREPAALGSVSEDEALRTVGPGAATHLVILKMFALIFVLLLWSCVVIVALCATDDYLKRWRNATDPDQCKSKNPTECSDSIKCQLFAVPITINGRTARCQPAPRRGLFDLSIQNVSTGENFRLYLIAISIALSSLPLYFVVHAVTRELKRIIRMAYLMPVNSYQPCGGMGAVGARTVLVGGLPKDRAISSDVGKFVEFVQAEPSRRKTLLEERASKESRSGQGHDANTEQPFRQGASPTATGGGLVNQAEPYGNSFELPPLSDLKSASADIARDRIVAGSVLLIREPPAGLIDTIKEEKEALDNLEDAVAEERFETDPAKKPVMKRLPPNLCKKKPLVETRKEELAEVRKKLERKLARRDKQKMTGAAIMTFDRPSSAFAFVRQFNKEQGIVGDVQARILGPREQVVWENLGVTRTQRRMRAILTVAVFTWLVFFWAVPVGFLGNLDRLEGIPGAGPAIGGSLNKMPTVVRTTLGAYLPVIVLTVFNILLPLIFRTFSRFGGAKTEGRIARSVLIMCAVFSIMSGIVMQAVLQGGFTQLIALVKNPSEQAVLDLIVGIVSPQGGYWFAFLMSAAGISCFVTLLLIGPVIVSYFLGKMANGRQEAYDRLFEPREQNYAYLAGRHLFFAAIGIFFYGTVAFIQPFAAAYAVAAYYCYRSVIIDGAQPETLPIIEFSEVLPFLHGVLALHTVASVGNVVVLGLKKSVGAPIIAAIALVVNLLLHLYVRRRLRPLIKPSPELVAELEREMDHLGVPRQKLSDVKPYMPDYALHEIDHDAERRIESAEYKRVDKTWPKADTEIVRDPPPRWCWFGEDEHAREEEMLQRGRPVMYDAGAQRLSPRQQRDSSGKVVESEPPFGGKAQG